MAFASETIVAVDVDDVLARTVPRLLDVSNTEFGCDLGPDDFCEDLCAMWGVSRPEAEERWIWICEEVLPNLEPLATVDEIRSALPRGVKALPLTSRRLDYQAMTAVWVDQCYPGLFLPARSANFPWKDDPNAHLLTKAQAVVELGAVGLVDDQPKHTRGVREVGRIAVCFGNYAWNKTLPDGVPRATDWEQVGKVLHDTLAT